MNQTTLVYNTSYNNYKSDSGDKSSVDRMNSSISTYNSYTDVYSSSSPPTSLKKQAINQPAAPLVAPIVPPQPPMTQPTTSANYKPTYKLIKCIGYGGYGRVYDAVRSDDGLQVIIKLIPKSGIVNWSSKSLTTIHNYKIGSYSSSSTSSSTSSRNTTSATNNTSFIPFEIECLLRLRDTPGIIKILDYFEETSCFVIVMEKLHRCTTLFDLANGKPFSFSQSVLRKIFTQLIKINLSIFAKGIVHRDIKPENILVNLDDYSIKLIDFGSAANFKYRGEPFREFQGTLECMPPEWVLSGFYESEPATAWSIGVTFYFCVFGKYPFRTKPQIVSGKFPLPYANVDNTLLQFLDCCFQMNFTKRFTLTQLLNSSWLKRYDKY